MRNYPHLPSRPIPSMNIAFNEYIYNPRECSGCIDLCKMMNAAVDNDCSKQYSNALLGTGIEICLNG